MIIFSDHLMVITLPAEFVANDRPILVQYQGEYYTPVFNFYPETAFGGDFATEADLSPISEVEVPDRVGWARWMSVSTTPRG